MNNASFVRRDVYTYVDQGQGRVLKVEISPLHEHDGSGIMIFEAKIKKLFVAAQPVKIIMYQMANAMFGSRKVIGFLKHISGAGHGLCNAEATRHCANESGFAGAKIALERYDLSAPENMGDLLAQRFHGFFPANDV